MDVIFEQRINNTAIKINGHINCTNPDCSNEAKGYTYFAQARCVSCGGNGYVKCHKCNGTGQVQTGTSSGSGGTKPTYAPCPFCCGNGQKVCSSCNGKKFR